MPPPRCGYAVPGTEFVCGDSAIARTDRRWQIAAGEWRIQRSIEIPRQISANLSRRCPVWALRRPIARFLWTIVRTKKPRLIPGLFLTFHYLSVVLHLLAVLSRIGRFVAVVDVTVTSPLAVMVYTLPPRNDTPVLVMAFVADPVYRVLKS